MELQLQSYTSEYVHQKESAMSWIEKCYTRLLIDNHITDLDPLFMSRFDPREYLRMVKLSGVESSMIYACDHNGNCYYPTRCGHRHAGIGERDIFGETVDLIRNAGIVPIAYYTLIYHNDSARRLPECRVRDINGLDRNGRYRFTCPNHRAAREFFKRQIAEVLAYPVAGIFLDMTYWPRICCCPGCRDEFRRRTGREIPETIDWSDPEWVAFQRFREESMSGFAAEMSGFVRSVRPDVTVTHQFSPVLAGWRLGQSSGIAAASDYASGDFYGGSLQQRFAVKVFDAYTRNRPFEFMTSRCVSLRDHTSTKSDDELFLSALTTFANGGASFFIDAIDPDGTLEEKFYRRLSAVTKRLAPFRAALERCRPRAAADVGIYFSMRSCVDRRFDGVPLRDFQDKFTEMGPHVDPVLEEALGFAKMLNRRGTPFKVAVDATTELSFRTLIVPNAGWLDAEETARLRGFVAAGGTLIATGFTSLFDPSGAGGGNFALAELFGADYAGKDVSDVFYIRDRAGNCVSCRGTAPLVTLRGGAEALARLTLPYYPPHDPEVYASIHSDPPGRDTDSPTVILNRFGRGRCVYIAPQVAAIDQYSQREYLEALLAPYLPENVVRCENRPVTAELTLLESDGGGSTFVAVVDVQHDLPNVPAADLGFSLKTDKVPESVIRVSDGKKMKFACSGGVLSWRLGKLENGEMFEIEWRRDP